jgi:hypothetical protein
MSEQLLNESPHLNAGQVRAEAEVRAVAEDGKITTDGTDVMPRDTAVPLVAILPEQR